MAWDGGPAPMYGRELDLDILTAFLGRARTDGAMLAVHGLPGVGVTTLLAHLRARALADGFTVLKVNGDIVQSTGFDALRQLIELLAMNLPARHGPTLAALRSAVAGSGPEAGPERIQEVADHLKILFQALSRPTLLLMKCQTSEDHLGLRVLSAFGRSRHPGLGVITSVGRAYLPMLPASVSTHEVRPLSPAAAREFLEVSRPELTARTREHLLREAAGLPLALADLPVTDWENDDPALLSSPRLGERVQDAFEGRLAALPELTRPALVLAALELGDDLTRLLYSSGSLPGLRTALEPAVAAGLLEPGAVRFSHPLTRWAVIDLATAQQRNHAHLLWAQALAGVHPAHAAYHRAEAAIGPDEQLAQQLEYLARLARREGDLVAAIAVAKHAARLSEDATARARRLAGAAYAGALSGRRSLASELLSRVRDSRPDVADSFAEIVINALLMLQGDGNVEAAYRLLAQGVDAHPDPADSRDVDLELVLRTMFRVCTLAERQDLYDDLRRRLERLRHPVPDALALALGTARLSAFHPVDLDHYHRTRARLLKTGALEDVLWVGDNLIMVQRLDEVRPRLEQKLPHLVEDEDGARIQTELMIAYAAMRTGDWDEALRIVRGRREREVSPTLGLAGWSLGAVSAQIAAWRGDLATAQATSDALLAYATPHGNGAARSFALQIRSSVALGAGNYEESFRILEMVTPIGTLAQGMSTPAYTAMDLVQAAVRTGRQTQARAHVRALQEARIERLSPYLALIVAGAAAIGAGSDPDAVDLFEVALAVPEAKRWPFDLARVQLAFGEQLRRVGTVNRARQQLTAARNTFARLDARPWTARANAELAASGEVSAQPSRSSGALVALLSPQERQVAQLAAAGLTNKQIAEKLFLSSRTIGNHLHRVFPKLGISSRAGLREALSELDGKA